MTSTGALVAIMAANAAAAERRLLDTLRVADATAPARAQLPESLGLSRDGAFSQLVAAGVLRDVGDGRVYLDEAALIARRGAGMRRGARIVLIMLLLASVLLALGVLMLVRRAPGELS
jgi:hypothetical protein